jgi:hypothetical protein
MGLKTGDQVNGRQWTEGSGSPEGALVGAIGDIYSDITAAGGNCFYVKTSGAGNTGWSPMGVEDHKVLVDGTDTTANYLASKIVAGSNITLTVLGGPGNETLQIAMTSYTPVGTLGAMAYFDRTTGALTSNGALNIDRLPGGVDPFGRPNIWDYRSVAGTGAVWKQGSWTSDGDPTDVQGEGAVFIGQNINGVLNSANGAYARIKKNRFGIYQIVTGDVIGDNPAGGSVTGAYIFQVNTDYFWLANNAVYVPASFGANITFQINRLTGWMFAKRAHFGSRTDDGIDGNVQIDGDIKGASTSYFYLGDPTTNGSWRWYISGTDLVFERRELTVWVQKGAFTA